MFLRLDLCSTLSIFVTSGGTWGCSGTSLQSSLSMFIHQRKSSHKWIQTRHLQLSAHVFFALFACLAGGSLPVSRCAKYGIFVTASAKGKKNCLHGRSSHLVPICSWRTFRCQYGKVIDVIGLCFSEQSQKAIWTWPVRMLLEVADTVTVKRYWVLWIYFLN